MNVQRIAQQPSWGNDPFDLKDTLLGLTVLNNNKSVFEYALELVHSYAAFNGQDYLLTTTMLSEDDQNELMRLFIEESGRDTAECIYGDDFSIDNNFTCALLAMLQDDCKDARDNLAEVLRKNILKYYAKTLNQILSEACESYQHVMHDGMHLMTYQDRDHGDFGSKY